MIYYLFLAIVDIGFYISENWEGLTATTIATAFGIIVGKRIGSRIAFNYAMRVLGISHKSQLEKQIEWLIEQERGRGNIWIAATSKRLKLDIRPAFFKLSRMPSMKRYIVPFAALHTLLRRMNMSRKLLLMIFGAIVPVLSQFGLSLDPDTIVQVSMLIMSGILGQSWVDANGIGQYAPLKEKLKSVKLWTALGGSVLIVLNDYFMFGVSQDLLYWIAGIGSSFIFGKSAVSFFKAKNNAGGNYEPDYSKASETAE